MDANEEFNVDELHQPHESATEWKLRREFMLTHHEKFSRNRLLCLANCFINVECYGCRYPGPVMAQLHELAAELSDEIQHHREAIKERSQVKFMKAGESAAGKDSNSDSGMARGGKSFVKAQNSGGAAASSISSGMRFVKSSEEYQSTKGGAPPPMASSQNWSSASGSGANKRRHQQSIQDFLILEHRHKSDGVNAVSILNESAGFNHADLDFCFREGPVKEQGDCATTCQVFLCGEFLAEATGTGKKLAKAMACEKALSNLRQTNYTIQIKQSADTDCSEVTREELGITREELVGKVQAGAIPDSNVGSKLLKLMGWAGGGIGKHGQGIAEPVQASGVVNREGLGLQTKQGVCQDFVPKILKIVNEYTASERQDDLRFSPDFSKEERALIHRECQKLGLKTHSHGKGDERFLVVSRKRSANQLLSHVIGSGGETSKYVLLPPALCSISLG